MNVKGIGALVLLMGIYSHLAAQGASPWLFTVAGDTLHQAFALDTGLFTTEIKSENGEKVSLDQVQAAFDGKTYYERLTLGSGLFSTERLLPRVKTGEFDIFDAGEETSVVNTNGTMVTPGTIPDGIHSYAITNRRYYYRFPGQQPVFVDIDGVRAGFAGKAPYTDMFATMDQQSSRKWLFLAGWLGSSTILYATMGEDAFGSPVMVLPLGCLVTGVVYWFKQGNTKNKILESFLAF